MPSEHKPGWTYVNSDNRLELEYAIHIETGWVYFADGVRYSPDEIKLFVESGILPTKAVHTVKKLFDGEIVGYESGPGTTDKGKSVESGGGKSNADNSDTNSKVSETTRNGAEIRDGELDIY